MRQMTVPNFKTPETGYKIYQRFRGQNSPAGCFADTPPQACIRKGTAPDRKAFYAGTPAAAGTKPRRGFGRRPCRRHDAGKGQGHDRREPYAGRHTKTTGRSRRATAEGGA